MVSQWWPLNVHITDTDPSPVMNNEIILNLAWACTNNMLKTQ